MTLSELLKNSRLVLAGGIIEKVLEKAIKYDVGAVTLGTYSSTPLSTHPPPFIIKVHDDCLINAYGVRKSYEEAAGFMKRVVGISKRRAVGVICSFVESDPDQARKAVKFYEQLGCDAVEFNPTPLLLAGFINPSDERRLVRFVGEIIQAAREASSLPLSVKFPSTVLDVAGAWAEWKLRGADIAHVMNAILPAASLPPPKFSPILKTPSRLGGLTGRCIKPVALAKVYQLSKSGEVEIIGTGGVIEPEDAVEMLAAGAKAVGVHSVLYLRGVGYLDRLIKAVER